MGQLNANNDINNPNYNNPNRKSQRDHVRRLQREHFGIVEG